MHLQQEIIKKIQNLLPEVSENDIKLTRPELSRGDFSTNIALVLFSNKEFRIKNKDFKSPLELAQRIAEQFMIPDSKFTILEKVEVVAPGFINFFLAEKNLTSNLAEILEKGDRYGRVGKLGDKKVMLEFADPNPFKQFHIGHLRNITLGESLARLLEAQGFQVMRVNYQGDVGMHVAKAIWGIQNSGKNVSELENKSLKEKVEFLGEAYTTGAKAYEEDEDVKKQMQSINVKIYQKDPNLLQVWETGKAWSLEHFEQIYKRVGTAYKRYYFESEVAGKGRQIVLDNTDNGIFEKSDGAVIFDGEKYGLHKRVFVTKEDYATYEAKDMALAGIKYEDFPYDRSIIITAHEQGPYFKVVLTAMSKVFPDLAEKTENITFGFVRLKDEKMSSRLGNIISGEWLLDEAKKRIAQNFKEMGEATLEMVAAGAVKYSMLKFSRQSDISFSFEDSISLEGNSGPYIQYSYARTQSVLSKTQSAESIGQRDNSQLSALSDKLESEETELLRMLSKFSEVVEEAGDNFAPNILALYLFELSQKYNLFYQKHKIVGSEKEEFRLALTKAVGQVIKNGLNLLGIESPQKM